MYCDKIYNDVNLYCIVNIGIHMQNAVCGCFFLIHLFCFFTLSNSHKKNTTIYKISNFEISKKSNCCYLFRRSQPISLNKNIVHLTELLNKNQTKKNKDNIQCKRFNENKENRFYRSSVNTSKNVKTLE